MNRRNLLKAIIGISTLGLVSNKAQAVYIDRQLEKTQEKSRDKKAVDIRLQTSPVAGFQYYDGDKIWEQLQVGSQLVLKSEPTNQYDADAVEIYWQDKSGKAHKLGYLPRKQNFAVSQMLQSGQTITASIEYLQESLSPWQRVKVCLMLNT